MIDTFSLKEDSGPLNIFKYLRYKKDFKRNNPNYFNPDGLVCFVGPQGSGKTLSAVNYVYQLMSYYPRAILVTNIDLKDYPVDDMRVFRFTGQEDLAYYKNGRFGVIYLIDEIQLYFNSLQSKNINMEVMTQISQQRKQRKHIVCTSQVFGRMAKPLREQFSCVCLCSCYFKFIQINKVLDRDSIEGDNSSDTTLKGKVKFKSIWFHKPEMYDRYDTYVVIQDNESNFKEGTKNVYGTDN